MRSTSRLYPVVDQWLHALAPGWHTSARHAVAHVLTALLVAQSLHPADLVRALDCLPAVPARQRFKRLARSWDRPWLAPTWLIPRLVRATLALVPPDPADWPTVGLTHLVLDSLRCGRWELITLGVRSHGRVLIVGWTVLPQPWPTGQFTPAVCALIRQVAASVPADRPVHLVADRGFPSQSLLRTLAAVGWGFTVRLRADARLLVDGQPTPVRTLLETARLGRWTSRSATYGGTTVAGQVVIGRGLVVLPWHQRDAASQRHRARQQAAQRRHRTQRWPGRAATDAWVVLFTSLPNQTVAGWVYRGRWAIEGAYRDLQGGWDGRHGWDLEAVLDRVTRQAQVERLVGLAALGVLLQSWIGRQAIHATDSVATAVAGWTTSGRLSVWAHGQMALTDPSGRLVDWITLQVVAGTDALAAAAPARPVRLPVARHPPPLRQAA
jgi:hypothetical protein